MSTSAAPKLSQVLDPTRRSISAARRKHDDPEPSLIIPGLYLGNIDHARSASIRNKYNIRYILSLTTPEMPPTKVPAGLQLKWVGIRDCECQYLLQYLPECCDFIQAALDERARVGGGSSSPAILVHCKMGVSRSASAVIAYLMRSQQLQYKDAFNLVAKQRPIINPNLAFLRQLLSWYKIGCQVTVNSPRLAKLATKFHDNRVREGVATYCALCDPETKSPPYMPWAVSEEAPADNVEDVTVANSLVKKERSKEKRTKDTSTEEPLSNQDPSSTSLSLRDGVERLSLAVKTKCHQTQNEG